MRLTLKKCVLLCFPSSSCIVVKKEEEKKERKRKIEEAKLAAVQNRRFWAKYGPIFLISFG